MVYVNGLQLPQNLQRKFKLNENPNDPQNFVNIDEVIKLVQDYNDDRLECDHIQLHQIITAEQVYLESDLAAIRRQWEEDSRPDSVKEEIKQRLMRSEDRRYQQSTKSINPQQKSALLGTEYKEYEKSMSFGVSFIFSIFASALVGYYLGIYFFQLQHQQSLVLAVFFLVGGLILETTLYIIKITKDQQVESLRKKYPSTTQQKKKSVNPTSRKEKKE